MRKGRLEAFSDGVIAIIITIMVLELRPPHGAEFSALVEVMPQFFAYLLSFVYLAIYWNNHHHMFQAVERIDGGVLWANNGLLFCLSLVPFSTSWMGENHFAGPPVAIYGVTLLLPALAYIVVQAAILRAEGSGSRLRQALGRDIKGKISPVLYVLGIALAFVVPALAEALYVLVALIWLLPDRRIERSLSEDRAD